MTKQTLLIVVAVAIAACLASYALRTETVPVSFTVAEPAELGSRARFDQVLEKRVSFKFQALPLDDAAKQIAGKIGRPVVLDTKALEDASVGPDTPVTLEVSGVTLHSALDQLLGRLDLTWVMKNETLIVTTPEKAGNELILAVYPVRDLVMQQTNRGVAFQYQQFGDLIDSVIAPTTWDTANGPGSIHEFAAAGVLVVSQTREAHAQIALLLAALRQARDAQGIRPGETTTAWFPWPNGVPPMGQGRSAAPTQTNSQPGPAGQPPPNAPAANSPVGTAPGGGFY